MYFPHSDPVSQIVCDHHHIKGYRKSEYLSLLQSRLLPLTRAGSKLNIEMVDSTTNANIQIADWIASSLAVYLNNKPMGDQYFAALKKSVLGQGFEFFADQWNVSQTKNSTDG